MGILAQNIMSENISFNQNRQVIIEQNPEIFPILVNFNKIFGKKMSKSLNNLHENNLCHDFLSTLNVKFTTAVRK